MMKNYEEALINLGAIFVPYEGSEDGDIDYAHLRDTNEYAKYYEILQEALNEYKILKERATPKLVKFLKGSDDFTKSSPSPYDSYYCPDCNTYLSKHKMVGIKFCHSCGQALKWSK